MCPKEDCKNNDLKHWSVVFTVLELITAMFQSTDLYMQFTLGTMQTLKKPICPLVLPQQLNMLPYAELNTFTHF